MTTFWQTAYLVAPLALVLVGGCASNPPMREGLVKSSGGCPAASLVRFTSFSSAQLKAVEFANRRPGNEFELEQARKLAQALYCELQLLLGPLSTVPCGGEFRSAPRPALLIEPRILEMHAVSPIEREWFTWGAGDSTLSLQVIFRDSSTGQVIAAPIFTRKAPLFWASWTSGQLDSELPEHVVEDVARYARENR